MSFKDRGSTHVVVHDDDSVTTIPKVNGTLPGPDDLVELPGGLTAGDLLYYDGAVLERVPIGSEGQVLTVVSGLPAWADNVGGGGSVFDPATATLEGWWRTAYSSSPHAGTASAGGSGARDLSEVTNPATVGAALGGRATFNFDGTNDRMNAANSNNFLTDSAGTIVVLFKADAATADAGAAAAYTMPALVTHSNGSLYVTYSSSGVRLGGVVGITHDSVAVAAGTGAWHLVVATWDATTLYLSIDGGAFSTKTHGVIVNANPMLIGVNYDTTARYDGLIADVMMGKFTADATFVSNIVEYVNDYHGTSF